MTLFLSLTAKVIEESDYLQEAYRIFVNSLYVPLVWIVMSTRLTHFVTQPAAAFCELVEI
jgi:hypothetical protein